MTRIKELRLAKGIKQIDLCKQLGVAQSSFSAWENNKFEPDITSLKKMSEIFGVSIDYILGNDEPPQEQLEKAEKVRAVDDSGNIVVIDDETRDFIDSLRKKPEMKMLFSVSKKATTEDILKTIKIIEALKEGD